MQRPESGWKTAYFAGNKGARECAADVAHDVTFRYSFFAASVSTRWAASKGQGVENWHNEPASASAYLAPAYQ